MVSEFPNPARDFAAEQFNEPPPPPEEKPTKQISHADSHSSKPLAEISDEQLSTIMAEAAQEEADARRRVAQSDKKSGIDTSGLATEATREKFKKKVTRDMQGDLQMRKTRAIIREALSDVRREAKVEQKNLNKRNRAKQEATQEKAELQKKFDQEVSNAWAKRAAHEKYDRTQRQIKAEEKALKREAQRKLDIASRNEERKKLKTASFDELAAQVSNPEALQDTPTRQKGYEMKTTNKDHLEDPKETVQVVDQSLIQPEQKPVTSQESAANAQQTATNEGFTDAEKAFFDEGEKIDENYHAKYNLKKHNKKLDKQIDSTIARADLKEGKKTLKDPFQPDAPDSPIRRMTGLSRDRGTGRQTSGEAYQTQMAEADRRLEATWKNAPKGKAAEFPSPEQARINDLKDKSVRQIQQELLKRFNLKIDEKGLVKLPIFGRKKAKENLNIPIVQTMIDIINSRYLKESKPKEQKVSPQRMRAERESKRSMSQREIAAQAAQQAYNKQPKRSFLSRLLGR